MFTTDQTSGLKPLFISKEARTVYNQAYDALLAKYRVKIKDHWIETRLGQAHVIETGNPQGKPVVLLHAAGCSAAEWYNNFRALGHDYRLFAVDMPGDAGKSVLAKEPESIGDYAETLLQILDHFQLDRPVLIGHSIGGFFATGFAITHPGRVEKLVLLSPVATHVPIRWYLRLLLKITGRPGTGPHAIKTLKMQAFKGFEPEPVFVSLMEAVRNFCTVQMLFPYVYPDADLARLKMPVYLIVGTEEPLCNYECSVNLAKRKFPNVDVTVLDETGHTPNMERPGEVNGLLCEILGE